MSHEESFPWRCWDTPALDIRRLCWEMRGFDDERMRGFVDEEIRRFDDEGMGDFFNRIRDNMYEK